MLKEFFDSLCSLIAQAKSPQLLRAEQEPSHVYYLRNSNGDVERVEAEAPDRKHEALDLTAIIDMATVDEANAVVWYSREYVVCVLDDDVRRDEIRMTVTLAPQILALQAMEGKTTTTNQKDLILQLRTTFAGCVQSPTDFLSTVRTINFSVNEEGGADLQHGKASMGKSVRAEVRGASQLPEEVTFMVPVFLDRIPVSPVEVRCALDVDVKSSSFRLIPLPCEVEKAIFESEEQMGALLRQAVKCPVRYGKP